VRAPTNALTASPYRRRDRHAVRDLLFRSYRTHTHLDWQETDQWLEEGEDYPARLAWQGTRLQGILAMSAPLNGTCWVRLAAVNDHADAQTVLNLLWEDLLPELHHHAIGTIALLVIRNWISSYAANLGFRYAEEIITFRRAEVGVPAHEAPAGLSIRLTQTSDLAEILRLDNRAFAPPWQMDAAELRQANRISASSTVAELNGKMVGYEISTLYFDGAHLARLAVDPSAQGVGVARALLLDTLRRFEKRGVHSMTVNTQASNERSQRLYTGYNFERTGYDLPVWMVEI